MIGFVVVSHSVPLAEAAREFALAMAVKDAPVIAVAAGAPSTDFGTSAKVILAAIRKVATPDGVLVFVDLGSAVLNADAAVDMIGLTSYRIQISQAAFVEGLVAAVAMAAAGASLAEVEAEACRARSHVSLSSQSLTVGWLDWDDVSTHAATCRVAGEHGLHARPAARVVDACRSIDARVRLRNVSTAGPFVQASSITEVMTLGAAARDVVLIEACGPHAVQALAAVVAVVGDELVARDGRLVEGQLVTISSGVGVGVASRGARSRAEWATVNYHQQDVAGELARLREARTKVAADLGATKERLGASEADIIESWRTVLDDPSLLDPIETDIRNGDAALGAWRSGLSTLVARLGDLSHPYQRQRAADIVDLRDRVTAELVHLPLTSPSTDRTVLIADELSAADVAELDPAMCAGIVAARGSATSHAGILARSLGIPTVVGAAPAFLESLLDQTVLVDATAGTVVMAPTPAELEAAHRQTSNRIVPDASSFKVATTSDGQAITVTANVSSAPQAEEASSTGADGVGLLRTEFMFSKLRVAPSVAEHIDAYTRVAEALGDRPLTIRTFDGAGDKPLWFLGGQLTRARRGLALTLTYPDILLAQLRAVVRVAASHSTRLLFPYVVSAADLRDALSILDQAFTLEQEDGNDVSMPAVGAMVENPAAILDLDEIVKQVDFLSVGTNDLTASIFGFDRDAQVDSAASAALDPSVLRFVQLVVTQGGQLPVSVCGELANELDAVPVLIGLGVRQLSVHPAQVPAVKAEVRRWTLTEAETTAMAAMALRTSQQVAELVCSARPTTPNEKRATS